MIHLPLKPAGLLVGLGLSYSLAPDVAVYIENAP